jgi:hypothetical protein
MKFTYSATFRLGRFKLVVMENHYYNSKCWCVALFKTHAKLVHGLVSPSTATPVIRPYNLVQSRQFFTHYNTHLRTQHTTTFSPQFHQGARNRIYVCFLNKLLLSLNTNVLQLLIRYQLQ